MSQKAGEPGDRQLRDSSTGVADQKTTGLWEGGDRMISQALPRSAS